MTNNKRANGLNMCRSRMFSKCYKALSVWTRSFDKCRWLSAGIIPVVSVLTANPQHNARSRSFDFLFPWASTNIPHMGFVARENYDTGNAIYKNLQFSYHLNTYSFIVFVPVNNLLKSLINLRTEFDILIFVYYSWCLAMMCHIPSTLLSKFH